MTVPPGLPVLQPVTGDDRQLRHTFREFLSGITVVSALWQGQLHAMTANAFCSVSLDPPQVLVCVAHATRFHAAISEAGRWAVSVLAAEQAGLAARFATSGRALETQFDNVGHTIGEHSGAALLTGALAWLECRTTTAVVAGDHSVVIGEVLATGLNPTGEPPLAYHRGGYGSETSLTA